MSTPHHTRLVPPPAITTSVQTGQVGGGATHQVGGGGATAVAVTLVSTGIRGEQGLPGVPGPAGPAGGDLHHTHTQAIPADTWVIAHNLGKYPAVSVIDSSGSEVEGEVSHIGPNQLTVSFSAGFSGTAHLN